VAALVALAQRWGALGQRIDPIFALPGDLRQPVDVKPSVEILHRSLDQSSLGYRQYLGAIHSSIADLRPAAKIPVPGHPEIPPVDYAWLRKLESKGHQDFIPPGLDNSINISQLLAGIEPPARRARDGNTYITNVHGGQVGVIGDKADVDGGINFHQGDE
jgi:hypothetical protein